jgi:hypothetical protein
MPRELQPPMRLFLGWSFINLGAFPAGEVLATADKPSISTTRIWLVDSISIPQPLSVPFLVLGVLDVLERIWLD